MICNSCNQRMKCIDTACDNNITARRYTCKTCNKTLYTAETKANPQQVLYILNKKKQEWQNGQRKII